MTNAEMLRVTASYMEGDKHQARTHAALIAGAEALELVSRYESALQEITAMDRQCRIVHTAAEMHSIAGSALAEDIGRKTEVTREVSAVSASPAAARGAEAKSASPPQASEKTQSPRVRGVQPRTAQPASG